MLPPVRATSAQPAASRADKQRRRRRPSPEEQARREAWGKKWGAIAKTTAIKARRKEGR